MNEISEKVCFDSNFAKAFVFQPVKVTLLFFLNRHFSRVTKSCIFKNLNLREKADRNFRLNFVKNCLGT